MEYKKEDLIKSPLNYVGGKFKLLPQILPLFPDDINTFYDMFCGGCNVGVNIKANKIVCNDKEQVVINLMNDWKQINSNQALKLLEETIDKYKLSKTNEEGFKNIRNDYNRGEKSWYMFYAMLTNAFNYQIRFNKNGEYNMPFGRNRSYFNPTLKSRFVKFINRLNNINIEFLNKDFRYLEPKELNDKDFVYFDPPYLVTCAAYNEKDGWNQQDDIDLMNLCDRLNDNNVKFAISNVFENKGKSNDMLKEWSNKYNVYHLNNTYANCNYHTKDKSKNNTDEVLITNY